jgi:hypothetical protein
MTNSSFPLKLSASLTLAGLVFLSCTRTTDQKAVDSIKQDTIQTLNVGVLNVQDSSPDQIVYDTLNFPGENYSVDILPTGVFHNDEVAPNSDKKVWFGLLRSNVTYRVAKTMINVTSVNDPILDEENEKSGWEVSTSSDDSCLLLIGNLTLPEREVQRVAVPEYIYPGDSVSFTHLDVNYTFVATGEKRKVQESPLWYEVWNYKLYFKSEKGGKVNKSLLVATPNFDDKMIMIIFAGDIDGDEILDLIIDTSRHYNGTTLTLYLSKQADKGEVLKPVGAHSSVGC